MGKKESLEKTLEPTAPKLVRRRENRKSTFRLGRTIGEKREKLETANERAAIYRKNRRKKTFRIIFTIIGFLALALIIIGISKLFLGQSEPITLEIADEAPIPTVEIIDEAIGSNSQITARMITFIARAERDLRALGLTPEKVIIPNGKIREVDFYLKDHAGFIKMTIDRSPAVSAEDTDRMLRYLSDKGITEFTYIDVRTDGKAYWK